RARSRQARKGGVVELLDGAGRRAAAGRPGRSRPVRPTTPRRRGVRHQLVRDPAERRGPPARRAGDAAGRSERDHRRLGRLPSRRRGRPGPAWHRDALRPGDGSRARRGPGRHDDDRRGGTPWKLRAKGAVLDMHTIELSDEELRMVYAALHSYLDDFGHKEADVLREIKALIAK